MISRGAYKQRGGNARGGKRKSLKETTVKKDEAPLVDPNGVPLRVSDINQSRGKEGRASAR